jgi:hypothetical protein
MIVISRARPPGLRPGRVHPHPPRTRYPPTSATPLRSSDNQAVRTNLIKVGACGDPLSSTAEQLATCISIHRDLARECAHLPPTGRVFLGVSGRMGKGRPGIGGQGCFGLAHRTRSPWGKRTRGQCSRSYLNES